MALIGNYSVLNKSHARFSNGTSTAGAYAANTKSNWTNQSISFAKLINSFPQQSSFPDGYNAGEAYIAPIKNGRLTSFTDINGVGYLTATALMVRLSEATIAGVGSVSTANLASFVPLVSNISGSASVSSSLGILTNMSSSISGTASLTASMSALAKIQSAISGSGSVTSDIKGRGALAATITIGGTGYLSNDDIERLADGFWSEDLTPYSGSTAGQALKDAGSAGNPWSALLVDNNTDGTFGWFVQKLLTVAKFLGLK